MVSFCCDQCQEVVKKPKIEKHFFTCRTHSVSCVDCGKTFDRASVSSHISCITEKEKYEKQQVSKELSQQRLEGDTNFYCRTCSVAFNSVLQGEQHYQSKRHISAAKRRLANENVTNGSDNVTVQKEDNHLQDTIVTNDKATGGTENHLKSSRTNGTSSDKKQTKTFSEKKAGLKRAIKKLVRSNGIRYSSLLKKLEKQGFSVLDLERRVLKRIEKSRQLFMDGKRVKLKN
ncbi:hypothetical protein GpartN1_g4389.t1 [Galdieria partita]|uniref:C2H2-type domain-containing protein n=1 Tax=Galdieria partita TaxID=83374 RepID=A0A9C7PX95_9RHOD|nr:hypothetical protein GpartN1_g4389.t1 [Galdieria partita]